MGHYSNPAIPAGIGALHAITQEKGRSLKPPELLAIDPSILEEPAQGADAHLSAMPRYRKGPRRAGLDVDEVTTGSPIERPARLLENPAKLFPGEARETFAHAGASLRCSTLGGS